MTQIPENPTLKDLQDHIKTIADERGWNKNNHLEIFLLLSEEIGELAKAVRNRIGLYAEKNIVANNEELELEFADVLNYLFDLANCFNINLEDAFRKKDKINAERIWKT
ncbi:MAG: RS21-C6 protein [Bacteroidetes bacterium]|nr:MAG: RS21-C6 protein [Bacteroidota bacterium]